MAMLCSRLGGIAARRVFPWELALDAYLFSTHLNTLALARYPLTEDQGPQHRCRGSSDEHTPAPGRADSAGGSVSLSHRHGVCFKQLRINTAFRQRREIF